jgi:hypothetical protein
MKGSACIGLFLFCLIIFNQANAEICADTATPLPVKKFKFIHSFDGKKSFLASQKVGIFGCRLGLQYKDKFRTGMGFYFLSGPSNEIYTFNETISPKTVKAKLDFSYLTLFYEPIVFQDCHQRWVLSVPTQMGVGTAQLSYMDSTQTVPERKVIYAKSAVLTEVVFMAEYRLFRWLGFGSGVGLRVMLTNDEIIKRNLNAPIYVFKIRIGWGELYKMTFKEKRKKKTK